LIVIRISPRNLHVDIFLLLVVCGRIKKGRKLAKLLCTGTNNLFTKLLEGRTFLKLLSLKIFNFYKGLSQCWVSKSGRIRSFWLDPHGILDRIQILAYKECRTSNKFGVEKKCKYNETHIGQLCSSII
jgi:hypothetical protein